MSTFFFQNNYNNLFTDNASASRYDSDLDNSLPLATPAGMKIVKMINAKCSLKE